MDTQERDNTPVKFWVQTERRLVGDPGQIWVQCCVIETVLNDHAENVMDAFSRHFAKERMDHRVSVWAVSEFTGTPVARTLRLFSTETETGMEYEFEQEIPATQGTPVVGFAVTEAPKAQTVSAGDGPAMDGAAPSASPGSDAGIDRAAAAGDTMEEGPEPSAAAFGMIVEDQLKRAAVELEESLRNVMLAQRSLNRKGSWWVYQDALEAVARASAVFSAAYLNWLAVN